MNALDKLTYGLQGMLLFPSPLSVVAAPVSVANKRHALRKQAKRSSGVVRFEIDCLQMGRPMPMTYAHEIPLVVLQT